MQFCLKQYDPFTVLCTVSCQEKTVQQRYEVLRRVMPCRRSDTEVECIPLKQNPFLEWDLTYVQIEVLKQYFYTPKS